jgi:hypothetical protein
MIVTNDLVLRQLSGDGRRVGANIQQVMGTLTIMTGTAEDLKPDNQLATFLLASNESYDNLVETFSQMDSEIQEIRKNGLPYVLYSALASRVNRNGACLLCSDFNYEPKDINVIFVSDWKFLNCVCGTLRLGLMITPPTDFS